MRNHVMATLYLVPCGLLAACSVSYVSPPPDEYVAPSTVIVQAPPDLPVYDQPPCPADGYIWTPGYWAWANGDYYWIPGTWVQPPQSGYLWTPGYWVSSGTVFVFHEGYWGERVGFYGGVPYGYGYTGRGYEGGRWDRGHFAYNQSVNNVNVTVVHNVYNTTVINNTTIVNNVTRVSYNGGNGGIAARPTQEEEQAGQMRHVGLVPGQTEQVRVARANPQLRVSANQGRPPIAATPRAGVFSDRDVVAAREGGQVHAPLATAVPHPNPVVHPTDLPTMQHESPNTGDPRLDHRYQDQRDKLAAQQNRERLDLQQRQDKDHQQLQRNGDAAKMQMLEQRHQQQTQTLAAKHNQQVQDLRTRQQPPRDNPHNRR
jgi:hypothetical protein